MISSGLCLFCRFIFVGFGYNKSSHSTWTTFSDGGHDPSVPYLLELQSALLLKKLSSKINFNNYH